MSQAMPSLGVLSSQQQQDELLRIFFSHNTATASSLASPAPIVSPYPAASYSRFLRSAATPPSSSDSSIDAAHSEHKEQATFLADTPTLFSAHSVLSPARVKAEEERQRRRTRHRTVPAAQLAGSEWRKPMQHTLHLPILKDITSNTQPAATSTITTSTTTTTTSPTPLTSTTSSLPPLSSTLSTVYYQSPAYEHSLHLSTSDDAIAYFSRMGSSSPVKFLYANRAWPLITTTSYASPYRPYDLLIVDRKYINPAEYFTISAHGIVQLSFTSSSSDETESTSLSEWVHQSSMFTLLRSIRFFKHFLLAKLFRLWARNVRYAIYCKQRRRLASSLFLARPSFCTALMEINDIMAGVRDERLWGVRSGAVYTAEGFGKEQSEVRSAAVKRVEGWVERVEDVLEGVCKGVKDRARLYDHRIANEELSNSRFAQHLSLLSDGGGGGGGGGTGGSGGKVKSMVKLKEEKRVRLQQLQHANREADMLGEFIRLVDYIEVETLVSKCIDNTAEFLSLLLNSSKPLFTTSVSFTTAAAAAAAAGSLLFTPTSSDIVGLLTSISDMTINSVDSLSRIIAHPKFTPLLSTSNPTSTSTSTTATATASNSSSSQPTSSSTTAASSNTADCLRVGRVVHADSGYVLMLGEMERRVASGFVGVNDSVRFLEKHRVVWEYGERVKERMAASLPLDEDDFVVAATASSAAAAAGAQVSPISSLTQTLSGLSRWSTQLQHIRDLYSSGLIQCDCRSLKSALLPIVQDGIARLKARMVQLFCAGVAAATADYAAMSTALRDEPVMLGQYVDYVRLVAETKRREGGEMKQRVKELAGLQSLMVDNDMYNANWIATNEQVKYDEMIEKCNKFGSDELMESDTKIESRWEEMKGKIMNEIKKWESNIDSLIKQTDDNVLYTDYNSFGSLVSTTVSQSSHGLRDVQTAIEAEYKRMKEMQKKTEEMQRQQLVLEETSHTFKGLTTLHDKWDKRKRFFMGVEALREREKKFWLGELDKVDVAAMANEVAAMDALAVAYTSKPAAVGGGSGGDEGAGKAAAAGVSSSAKAVKESERSAEVVKREMEMVKNMRTDLNFYGLFLSIVRDLQYCYQVLGHEGYRAAFGSSSGSGTASVSSGGGGGGGGFGHWKRMKDLKKIDWTVHRATISAVVERLRAERGANETVGGGSSEAADEQKDK